MDNVLILQETSAHFTLNCQVCENQYEQPNPRPIETLLGICPECREDLKELVMKQREQKKAFGDLIKKAENLGI